MATLSVSFDAQPRGIEVVFDAAKQQQMLSFNLSVQMPLLDLYQALRAMPPEGFALPGTSGAPTPGLPSESTARPEAVSTWLEPRKVPISSSQAPALPTSPKEPMLRALRYGDVAAVRKLLESRKGELQDLVPRGAGSLLHVALESSSVRLDLVKTLLEGRCSPNAVNEEGRTPLHLAVLQVDSFSPIVARLLLLARAEPEQRDRNGLMPVDCLKSCAGSHAVSSNVKQIMSEMVGAPTLQVAVFEREQMLRACFADRRCEAVVFQTEQAVGLYDIGTGRVRYRKELSSGGKHFIRSMAVNPSTGGVALLLEVGTTSRDLVMFWPSGQLDDEEPLKWTVEGDSSGAGTSRSAPGIALSQTAYSAKSNPVILCRTSSGSILAWQLLPMGAQLLGEKTLVEGTGGVLSLSFHGGWAALQPSEEKLQVWAFGGGSAEAEPWQADLVCTVERNLLAFAVIEDTSPNCCLLAMTGLENSPAQVWRVQRKGTRELVHRVMPDSSSNIRYLGFCGEDSDSLLGVLEDGLVMLCQLQGGSQTCIFDDGSLRTVDISRDRKLMVSSLQECFRIFRVGSGAE